MDFLYRDRARRETISDLATIKVHEKQRKLSVLSDDGILNQVVDKVRRCSVRDEPISSSSLFPSKSSKANKGSDRVDFVGHFGGLPKQILYKDFKKSESDASKKISPQETVLEENSQQRETGHLPEGVIILDHEDDSCAVYGQDINLYLRHRERIYNSALSGGIPDFCKSRDLVARTKVVNWLVYVVHYFKFSQQTFYLAVSLFDRVAITSSIGLELQQLLGVTCVLIASKMEEYYPASFEKLIAVTQSSYTDVELCRMERAIYRHLKFDVICDEPVTFLDRFMAAAEKTGDKIFREMCFFMMETIVTDLSIWYNLTSKKSAAAVYSALLIESVDEEEILPKVWTKSLQFYTGFQDIELSEISTAMLKKAEAVTRDLSSDASKNLKKEFLDGVAVKYRSVSRHKGLLTLPVMGHSNIVFALNFIKRAGRPQNDDTKDVFSS